MDYILFDLDGTITNSKLGITKSIQYALRYMDIDIEDLDSLSKHIGPPLRDSLEGYGFQNEEVDQAIAKYREYYKTTGIYENELYDGIGDLLNKLKKAGKKLILATSKPEVFAQEILTHFHLTDYFDDICGATIDESRSHKKDVIQYALDKNHIQDYSNVVMVGDRKYDIEGAKAVGIPSIGVLYGFGDYQEIKVAGADKIAETVQELFDIITNL